MLCPHILEDLLHLVIRETVLPLQFAILEASDVQHLPVGLAGWGRACKAQQQQQQQQQSGAAVRRGGCSSGWGQQSGTAAAAVVGDSSQVQRLQQ